MERSDFSHKRLLDIFQRSYDEWKLNIDDMPDDDIVKKNIAQDFKEIVGQIPANAE